jgi:spore coat protein U-like protein
LPAWPSAANTSVDVTELSLEQLMQVELPALNTTARFTVSATAIDSCTVSAAPLSFGSYDALRQAPTDATSSIQVTCTVGTTYQVALDAGLGNGATVQSRAMQRGGQLLRYTLFRDPTRALVWGETPNRDTLAGVGSGMPVEHVVYGRIAPRQPVPGGTYLDTVTATVLY